MKKLYLFLVALCLGYGLSAIAVPFRLGIKGGFNLNQALNIQQVLNSVSVAGEANDTRIQGGICAEYRFGDALSLNVEALWNPKGGKYEMESPYYFGKKIYTFFRNDYISTPLYLRLNLSSPSGKGFSSDLYLCGGVEYSYLIQSKFQLKDEDDELYDEEDVLVECNRTDLAYLVGAGYMTNNGRMITTLEIRYVSGLNPVFKKTSSNVLNRSISLSIGFAWNVY